MKDFALIGLLLLSSSVTASAQQANSAVITGQLIFADGLPASGITIAAVLVSEPGKPAGPGRNARTNEAGGYRIPPPPAGRYLIKATIGGSFIYYPGVSTEAAATVVTVGPDSPSSNLDIVLPPSASGVKLTGHVTIPANQMLASDNRKVVLVSGNFSVPPQTTAITTEETFEFNHVFPGAYSLNIPAPGFQPAKVTAGSTDVGGVELIVPRLTSVVANVTIDGNNSVPRFQMKFESPDYQIAVPSMANGSVSAQVPAGSYRFMVTGLSSGYYLKSLAKGSSDLLVTPLKIASGDATVRLDLSIGLSNGVKVGGRVIGSNDDPATEFPRKLILDAAAVDESAQALIQPDGSFEIPRISPGTYLARVTLSRTVSSASIPVTIPAKDVGNLEIPVPPPKEVFGRVTVDGYGPPPRFTLLLIRGSDLSLPSTPVAPAMLTSLVRNTSPGNQILQVNVNALPDGTFRMKLPQGNYRVMISPANGGVPAPYIVRSINYGSADLTTESMNISDKENAELQLSFGTAIPNPWVRVSGRVKGFDPLQGPYRIALESNSTSAIETLLNQDGSFDFPNVLVKNNYTARLLPANDASTSPRVTVAEKDVTGVEITVPREREVLGTVTVDGNRVAPGFVLTMSGTGTTVSLIVKPETNGTFRVKLPEDDRRVSVGGLALGYQVKALTYGTTDLLKQPLRVSETAELRLTLTTDPNARVGSLKGRITDLGPDQGGIRIALSGVTAFSSFESALDAGGTFTFSDIPQGSYLLSLNGGTSSFSLMPSSIVVTGGEQSGIEISASKQSSAPTPPRAESPATGTSITDIGGASRQAASDSAAVASLRSIVTAEVTYLSMSGGKFASLDELIAGRLLDARFGGVISGYRFSVISLGSTFAAAAVPVIIEQGSYAFYNTPDGVVRYAAAELLAPFARNGKPVQ